MHIPLFKRTPPTPTAHKGSQSGVVIRDATHADYSDVMDIDQNLYMGRDYLPSTYHHILDTPHTKAVVCEVKDEVVGYAAGHLVDDGHSLVWSSGRVKSSHRCQGYTKQMLGVIREHFLCESRSVKIKQEVLVTKGENLIQDKTAFYNEYKEVLQRKLINFIIKRDRLVDILCETETSGLQENCHVQNLSTSEDRNTTKSIMANLLTLSTSSTQTRRPFLHDTFIITNWTPHSIYPHNADSIIDSNHIVLLSQLDGNLPNTHSVTTSRSFTSTRQSKNYATDSTDSIPSNFPKTFSKPSTADTCIIDNKEAILNLDNQQNFSHNPIDDSRSLHSSLSEKPKQNARNRGDRGSNNKSLSIDGFTDLRFEADFGPTAKSSSGVRNTLDKTENGESQIILSVGNHFRCKLGLAYNIDLYYYSSNNYPDHNMALHDYVRCHLVHHLQHALVQGGHDPIHVIVFVGTDDRQVDTVCDVMASYGLFPEQWNVKNLHLYRRFI